MPPNPPADSDPHRYVFELFRQVNEQTDTWPESDRVQFPIEPYIADHQLTPLKAIGFLTQQSVNDDPPTKRLTHRYQSDGNSSVNKHQSDNNPSSNNKVNSNSSVKHRGHANYFKSTSTLTPKQESYVACTLHVAAQDTKECLENEAWGSTSNGKTCYNPYAVCASRVGTTTKKGGESLAFENLPDDELLAYAYLRQLNVNDTMPRQQVLDAIHAYKSSEM